MGVHSCRALVGMVAAARRQGAGVAQQAVAGYDRWNRSLGGRNVVGDGLLT